MLLDQSADLFHLPSYVIYSLEILLGSKFCWNFHLPDQTFKVLVSSETNIDGFNLLRIPGISEGNAKLIRNIYDSGDLYCSVVNKSIDRWCCLPSQQNSLPRRSATERAWYWTVIEAFCQVSLVTWVPHWSADYYYVYIETADQYCTGLEVVIGWKFKFNGLCGYEKYYKG